VLLVEKEKVSIDVHVKINLTLIPVMFSFTLSLNKHAFSLQVLTTEKFLLFDVVDPHLATSLDFFHGQLPYSHPLATLHG
jgi:hypothetical protein